jgi:hypothetical protein
MTDKEFCKLDTEFYGEEVDYIKQISLRTFNGEELKEYVEHCIKLNLLTIPVVIDMCCPYCKSKDIVWYGKTDDCECNDCGKKAMIICL